jgi:hypothetical protein
LIGGPPKPGIVTRYLYDWSVPGEVSPPWAGKERPAVIVLMVMRSADRFVVRVAPITHRQPQDMARAMEIPPATKLRFGLDGERSWVILDYANEFVWPSPDVRPVPGRDPVSIYYGPASPAFYSALKQKLLGLLRPGRARARIRGQ